MGFVDKILSKSRDNKNLEGVTVAFLGDSVTQGCFELYPNANGEYDTVFDGEYAYHKYFGKILHTLYPSVPINIINAGISGGTATHGLERLKRDVLSHKPDLVVVCFGLNDAVSGTIDEYTYALNQIFKKLACERVETIFMTPNMMCDEVNPYLIDEPMLETAQLCMNIQVNGTMDSYIKAARTVCADNGIKICDCYNRWKKLSTRGVKITDMLANRINHPTRTMNWLFAISLIETVLDQTMDTR